jgi:hypothetical protein
MMNATRDLTDSVKRRAPLGAWLADWMLPSSTPFEHAHLDFHGGADLEFKLPLSDVNYT